MKALIVFVCVVVVGVCFGIGAEREEHPKDPLMLKLFYKALPGRRRIYGVVKDQWGNGVSDAEVTITWMKADVLIGAICANTDSKVRTDKDGLWEAVLNKPLSGAVSASKDGYEELSSPDDDIVKYKSSRSKPLVIVLRKKGPPTFLIEKPGGASSWRLIEADYPHSKTNRLNFFRAGEWDVIKVPPYTDLVSEVRYDVEGGGYQIRFSTVGEGDGLIMRQERLYEAPVDGYEREVVLDGTNTVLRDGWVCLYLKTRKPPLYSKLYLDFSLYPRWDPTNVESVIVSYEGVINPYGERNLEKDKRVRQVWNLYKKLEREVKEALAQGRYPEKPDMDKEIEEGRAKMEAEKAAAWAEYERERKASSQSSQK